AGSVRPGRFLPVLRPLRLPGHQGWRQRGSAVGGRGPEDAGLLREEAPGIRPAGVVPRARRIDPGAVWKEARMSPISRSLNHAGLPIAQAGPARLGRHVLAGALGACATASGFVAWNIHSFVGRFDTLGYLLQEAHTVQIARLRAALLVAALCFAGVAVVALVA